MKQILAFTNSSFAYAANREKAIIKLNDQLRKNNSSADKISLYDVSSIPEGTNIAHENGEVSYNGETFAAEIIDNPFKK
jgi:hypothetical protein